MGRGQIEETSWFVFGKAFRNDAVFINGNRLHMSAFKTELLSHSGITRLFANSQITGRKQAAKTSD